MVSLCALSARSQERSPINPLPTAKVSSSAEVAGTGTTNKVPRWTDGVGTLGDSALYSDPGTGWVGLGTNTPSGQFHIFGNSNQDLFAGMGVDLVNGPAFNFGYGGSSFGAGAGFFNVRPNVLAVAPNPSLRFMTANAQRMIITNIGRVGIGTTAPAYVLDVNGAGHFSGALTVDGNIAAKYQDVAEWVASDDDLAPGTVVVIDSETIDGVTSSARPYDSHVAGVVSSQPGLALGTQGEGKFQIATVGRVRVKADASHGSIAIGDLLVTSDVTGTAMKSQPVKIGDIEMHRPGTLLGKALEPLASGQGEILVLLSLQ